MVIIHVKDVNDMPPVFDEKSYRTDIDEELPGSYPLKLIQVRVKTGLVVVVKNEKTFRVDLFLMMERVKRWALKERAVLKYSNKSTTLK